jgi:hypothetical protein
VTLRRRWARAPLWQRILLPLWVIALVLEIVNVVLLVTTDRDLGLALAVPIGVLGAATMFFWIRELVRTSRG